MMPRRLSVGDDGSALSWRAIRPALAAVPAAPRRARYHGPLPLPRSLRSSETTCPPPQISTDDGTETEIGEESGAAADARTAAGDGPGGSMAMAGAAVAIDEDEPKTIKPKPEKAVKKVEAVAPVEAVKDIPAPVKETADPAAPAPAEVAPVQLPSTGTGGTADGLGRSLALLGAGLLLGGTLLAGRRFQRS